MGTPSGAKMTITRDDKRIDGTEKFTAEQALRPRQAKGKLKFVQNCDEGSKIVFRRTPMDRYTDTVCVVDEEGQTLGNPWTEVCGPAFSNCGLPCPPPQGPHALSSPHLTWASCRLHLHNPASQ